MSVSQLENLVNSHNSIRDNVESIIQEKNISIDELAKFSADNIKQLVRLYQNYTKTEWSARNTYEREFIKMYLANENVPVNDKIAILFQDISTSGEYHAVTNISPYVDFIITFMNSKIDDIRKEQYSGSIIGIIKALNKGNIIFKLEHIKNLEYDVIHYIIDSYATSDMFCRLTKNNKKRNTKKEENKGDEPSNNTCESSDDSDDNDEEYGYRRYEPYYSSRYDMTSMHKFIVHACMVASEKSKEIPNSWYRALVKSSHAKLQLFPMKVTTFKGELLSQLQAHYENVSLSPVIEYRRSPGILLDNSNSRFHSYADFIEIEKKGGCYCRSIAFELPYMSYGYISHVEIDVHDKKPSKLYITNGTDYNLQKFKKCDRKSYEFVRDVLTVTKKNNDCNVSTYVTISFDFSEYVSIKDIRFYGEAISFV